MLLFIILCKVVLRFESVNETLKCNNSFQNTEQYFSLVLFIMLYKMRVKFESVNVIIKCHHLNESH